MQFLIEIRDKETACIATEIPFEVEQIADLRTILGWDDFHPHGTYELDSSDIHRINSHFNQNIDVTAFAKVRQRMPIDELPYQIHTGRELALMLEGKKPLSVFTGEHPPCPEIEEIPERLFEPYVVAGRIIKKEYIESARGSAVQIIRRVLYALPEESWRINAYALLLETAKKAGWCEGFERMEGSLLGYTDQQNDAYVDYLKVGFPQFLRNHSDMTSVIVKK